MINYLSQLGWNDGTEQEIYETEELIKLFSTDRINKSPAVFDTAKLNWMNGQHIRLMPEDKQVEMIGAALVENGLAEDVNSEFTKKAVALCANGIELVQDATAEVRQILEYPLAENVADATPLNKLKASVEGLRSEMKVMEVRIGVVSNALLRMDLERRDARSAA